MPGPLPKNRQTRQRAGSKPSSLLEESAPAIGPQPLPPLAPWHHMTEAWWADLWRSPMAGEYVQSDLHGLIQLAVLMDAFWTSESPAAARDFAVEIRLQSQRYGLSPLDRRRLQWEVKRVEATEKPAAPASPSRPRDPRLRLAG